MNQKLRTCSSNYFYLFLLLQIMCWTLLPTILQKTPPLDVIEALAWGREWQWGYDKDPFLISWLLGLINRWSDTQLWPLYLLSQLAVVSCFIAVWRLAQRMQFSQQQRLLAVILLEGIFYYSYSTPEFNDNILLLPTWSWLCLSFYNAITRQKLSDWIGVGIFAGLALMAKYSSVILLLCMLIFLLRMPKARQSLSNWKFYLGLIIFVIIIAPNMFWLYRNHFITINYAVNRAQSDFDLLPQIINPLRFFLGQLLVILPTLGLFKWLKRRSLIVTNHVSAFDRSFIREMCLGPFIAMVLFSLITGLQLRFMWATPLFSLLGLLLLTHFPITLQDDSLRRFFKGVVIVFIVYLLGYTLVTEFGAYLTKEGKSAQFPGKELATIVTEQWHQTYQQPVKFVGGSRWLSGNIAYYSVDSPTAFFDWDLRTSPWVKVEEVKRTGAIFVWDANIQSNSMPKSLKKFFPQIKQQPQLTLEWRGWVKLVPIHIGVGFLPPENE